MANVRPLAVQLYSLREEIKTDVGGVLTRLAEIGYVGVEPYAGLDHQVVAEQAKALGLQIPSSHLPAPLGDDAGWVFAAAERYGLEQIIIPYLPPEHFQSVDAINRTCDFLNQACDAANDAGFSLAYHNHDFEYEAVDGRLVYEIMFEQLDPRVQFQVDTYWVKVAGQDPVAVLKQLGARVPSLHIKDGPGLKGEPMVAVGQGSIDVRAIINAVHENTGWLIVELDACDGDMMTAIAGSYDYLVKEGLGRGKTN